MPEYPDLTVYVEHIERRVKGDRLTGVRLTSPFLLRSVTPALDEVVGREVVAVQRLAKQLVLALADGYFVVIHLMIAGRLRWHDAKPNAPPQAVPKRNGLAAFDFEAGSLIFTEASKKKRASLRFVHGETALAALDPGGLEVFDIDFDAFYARLLETPHTVKRALTDQRVFAGIGNAYSDEILFRARMSPFKQGRHMSEDDARGLFAACRGPYGMGGTVARRGRGQVPGPGRQQGDGLPSRDGGTRQVPRALSGLRDPGPAHRSAGERDELLRHLPDRRTAARRPVTLPAAEGHLPAADRGLGGVGFRNADGGSAFDPACRPCTTNARRAQSPSEASPRRTRSAFSSSHHQVSAQAGRCSGGCSGRPKRSQ